MNGTPTLPALSGNFVLLKADGLQLLLPQQDVGAAEYLDSAPLSHSAIALPVTPGSVQVSDAALCPLSDTSDLWPLVALSCFEIKGRAVPILDTSRLFGLYHG